MKAKNEDRAPYLVPVANADLKPFIGVVQLATMRHYARGEEKEWFIARMVELAALIHAMPKTYEQDGAGLNAVAHLHYFTAGGDWYITEKDSDPDGEGQIQAFGSANLGYGAELGYISIKELIEHGAELDLHFKPATLATITKAAA